MTRTPPPTQPNGYEKSTAVVKIICTPTEKLFWQAVFGGGKLSSVARGLLHSKAHKALKIPRGTQKGLH